MASFLNILDRTRNPLRSPHPLHPTWESTNMQNESKCMAFAHTWVFISLSEHSRYSVKWVLFIWSENLIHKIKDSEAFPIFPQPNTVTLVDLYSFLYTAMQFKGFNLNKLCFDWYFCNALCWWIVWYHFASLIT